jgi:hypothetical protein
MGSMHFHFIFQVQLEARFKNHKGTYSPTQRKTTTNYNNLKQTNCMKN